MTDRLNPDQVNAMTGVVKRAGIGVAMLIALVVWISVSEWVSVSSNEHCIQTRYGKPVDPEMSPGLHLLVISKAVCFPLLNTTLGPVPFQAMARDSVLVSGQFTYVWHHNPTEIVKLYQANGSARTAQALIEQAATAGLQRAINRYRSDELYSQPQQVDASLKEEIDNVEHGQAFTVNAFVRNVLPPEGILLARQAVQQKGLELKAAQRQLATDSAQATGRVIQATATAEAKRLEAQSYAQNAKLLDLEIAKATAEGLKNVCKGVTTCILGQSILGAWTGGK